MLTALDHVQPAAPAGSEDVLRTFCITALGMTEIPKPPVLARRGGCWFTGDGGQVQIHVGVEDGFRPPRRAHPAVRVTDLDEPAARLEQHGAPVAWGISLPGHRRFFTQDPVGNRLEFLQPLR
ncbi:glyoxalase [Streptomyces albospinus]|uniref:Glyoxalase n=1 Tax=Streptomyces albospinus TaxID=285515 RepID=A0ABQ2VM16_9ACTN|nr:glyoxalase [Streptomyces albospinus]GGU97752.1 glyoxalase [Streptomyces albospinus]